MIVLGEEKQKMTSYNNQTGAVYKKYSFTETSSSTSDPAELDVMVKAEPKEMKGIQSLWKIAIDCKDNKVGEAVTQLLLGLHT